MTVSAEVASVLAVVTHHVRGLTLQLNNFDREVLLAYTEDLEIAEDGLLGFGVAVDFDAQEIALVLPVELTLHEQERERGFRLHIR